MRCRSSKHEWDIVLTKVKKPTGDLSAAAKSQGEEKTNVTHQWVLEVLSEWTQLTAKAWDFMQCWLATDEPFCLSNLLSRAVYKCRKEK